MAWALDVVIGKYQVVEDLKDSDESERATLFLCAYFSGTTKQLFKQKPMCQWYITGKKQMKKRILLSCIAASAVMLFSSCASTSRTVIPQAVNSIKAVSFEELNLTNKDYDVLNRVEASARIEVEFDGNSWTAKDPDGTFELKVNKDLKTDKTTVTIVGVVRAGYLFSQNGYNLDPEQPGDLALRMAIYRLINMVKEQGGDGIIEPIVSTGVEETKRGSAVTYITTVSGKPVRLKSSK